MVLKGFCVHSILQDVCENRRRSGGKLTIQEVLTILKHPGIIGNDDLAKDIESVLLDMGHTVSSMKLLSSLEYKCIMYL